VETLLWILALFGLWQLASLIWRWLLSFRFVPPQVSLLFLVKNNQDSVEGLFRQLAWDCFFSGRYAAPGRVVAVDLGSKDQTPAILRRLATEYSFLHFRTMTEEQLAAEILPELSLGVLVLDLRVLSAKQALEAARWLLQKRPSGKAKDRPAQEASF